MIELSLQIKLIFFSFIFGFFFSVFLENFNKKVKMLSNFVKILLSFFVVFIMTFIYFIGIQKIGNAIFHPYLLFSIVLGFVLYDLIVKVIENKNKKWYTYYGDDMAKRRISKASKRRLSLFGPLCIFFIIYFCVSLVYNIYSIYNLTLEKSNLKKEYLLLQEKSDELKKDIDKLNDPKYLADYAREQYLYSKNGEYIIQIDKDGLNDSIESIDSNINKNYVIISLTVVMLLVFIYIFAKSKKVKKKRKGL